MKNIQIKKMDVILFIIVFVIVSVLAIISIQEHRYRIALADSMQELQIKLTDAEERNRVHEEEEINTDPIEVMFVNSVGQVRVVKAMSITAPSYGELSIVDNNGEAWIVASTYTEGDELLLFIDDKGTPTDSSDDVVIGISVYQQLVE